MNQKVKLSIAHQRNVIPTNKFQQFSIISRVKLWFLEKHASVNRLKSQGNRFANVYRWSNLSEPHSTHHAVWSQETHRVRRNFVSFLNFFDTKTSESKPSELHNIALLNEVVTRYNPFYSFFVVLQKRERHSSFPDEIIIFKS